MSFIIGVTIGYIYVQIMQITNDKLEENVFYNQNISNYQNGNINKFINIEIGKKEELRTNEKNKDFIFRDEIIYENQTNNKNQNKGWEIRIPKIGLKAIIEEGTSKEILDEFVGHFEETNKLYGNIGLAAHNRGYKVNYFEKIKYLEIGDEIYYSYCGTEMLYVITSKKIIKDTNWKVLENTKDNRITLITCVENKPQNRLCLQGIEKNK